MGSTDQERWVDEVKAEWRELWTRRLEDEERAEGIADRDYSLLFVEKGLIIYATRACKPPRLDEILKAHGVETTTRTPPPSVGGWGRFIKTVVRKQTARRAPTPKPETVDRRASLQSKKGGRGWLHIGTR